MITLGIYNLGADPSAALVKDGKTIAFIEEERLIRLKHAEGHFPINAIEQVLIQSGTEWKDIDNIAIPWECQKYDSEYMSSHYETINSKYHISHPADLMYEKNKLSFFKSKSQSTFIIKNLKRHFGEINFPEINFVNHHLSHACTAFFTSGLNSSLVLTLDGSGEDITISIWIGDGKILSLLKEVKTPVSLGWFYSAVTEYLGFHAYGDEWQVMGLSSYGRKGAVYQEAKRKFASIIWNDNNGGVEADPHLISLGEKSFSSFCSDSFVKLMGKLPRAQCDQIVQWHKDIAYAAQLHLEETVLQLVEFWIEKTNTHNLCLAGGVAMNVKMNGKLFESEKLNNVYVYPISSDTGTSVGAALAHQYNINNGLINCPIRNVYLGNSYTDDLIEEYLTKCKLKYFKPDDLELYVASKIESGKIIAWFQLGMEGGQRALGARSILADPRNANSRDVVNSIIKYRQPWRPFCPSVLYEYVAQYFELSEKIEQNYNTPMFDFMTLTLKTNTLASEKIPAVIHVDGTSRIQIVHESSNPRYYKLIEEFEKLTGVGVLLNTSFNIKGEPIVCTPLDAIRTFYSTGLDILAIGNCIVEK